MKTNAYIDVFMVDETGRNPDGPVALTRPSASEIENTSIGTDIKVSILVGARSSRLTLGKKVARDWKKKIHGALLKLFTILTVAVSVVHLVGIFMIDASCNAAYQYNSHWPSRK
ncbi:hypothetical protein RvY_08584 [Ramazzottius varieornatus]|uniref:Uncharacterized protein n=1 Tax=Ramazzottius varieornatus TaxID=947166 RepID=A0A1D1VBZ3_RAMVA|nr:hypothetical protein RvY_08584 [Ramazzottius varieornatus]